MRRALLRDEDRVPEMTVVRNEFERGENSPFQVLYKHTFATAFREHPYHHPTIGWRSDIEEVSTARLREFYDTFYHPNNATAMVIGDFDEAETLALLAREFGKIPASTLPIPQVYTVEPPQEGERRFVVRRVGPGGLGRALLEDRRGACMPTRRALAVLGNILGGGITSRLHQALVEKTPRALGHGRPLAAPRSGALLGVRSGAAGRRALRGRVGHPPRDRPDRRRRRDRGRVREGAHADRGRGDLRPRLERSDRRVALGGHRRRRLGVVRGLSRRDPGGDAGGRAARRPRASPRRRPDGRALPARRPADAGAGRRRKAKRSEGEGEAA